MGRQGGGLCPRGLFCAGDSRDLEVSLQAIGSHWRVRTGAGIIEGMIL